MVPRKKKPKQNHQPRLVRLPRSRGPPPATRRRATLVSYFVGQGVGLSTSVKSATAVVQEFKEYFADPLAHKRAGGGLY